MFQLPLIVQAQIVRGQVLENGSERPIAGATVAAVARDSLVAMTAATDSTGVFVLALARGGTFTLAIRHVGHIAGVSRPFELRAGDEYEPTLYLSPAVAAQPLTPVTIRERASPRVDFSNGFEARRALGFGEFITRDQIARRGNTTPMELLRGVAGVTIARDKLGEEFAISSRGYIGRDRFGNDRPCPMPVYVDGMLLFGQTLNDMIHPSDLEGLEVYSSGARLPAQFRGQDAGCGAILIWTRKP